MRIKVFRILAPVLGVILVGCSKHSDLPAEPEALATVSQGVFEQWLSYRGPIDARHPHTVASRLTQQAVLVELAAEGTRVKSGDVLARFDASPIDQQLIRLRKELALAEAEKQELEQVELPSQRAQFKIDQAELAQQLNEERALLKDNQELVDEGLIPRQELDRQQAKVAHLANQLIALSNQAARVTTFLHPALQQKVDARLEAARGQWAEMQQQASNCVLRASVAGMVLYQPQHLGGEFRTARLGDTVFRNQPFLILADMQDLVARCQVPEQEWGRIRMGAEVRVQPLALPSLALKGKVSHSGSMAQSLPGRPVWQKFFPLEISLDESDERLRSGMTARIEVLAYRKRQALLLPRAAVRWRGDEAYVISRDGPELPLRLGQGNALHFEVIEGLDAGQQVRLP